MDKSGLNEKKLSLKRKLQVDSEIRQHISDLLPVFFYLDKADVPYTVEYLHCVEPESLEFWEKALKSTLFLNSPFGPQHLKVSSSLYIHEALEQNFPSVYPLRYMPPSGIKCRTEDQPAAEIIQKAGISLQLSGSELYFFYLRYAPVIKIHFQDLVEHVNELYSLPEDICILTTDYKKIIFRSLEDEWSWSSSKN